VAKLSDIDVHFDAMFTRAELAALAKRLSGMSSGQRRDTLHHGIIRAANVDSRMTDIRWVLDISRYLVLWTAWRLREITFATLRRDPEFLDYLRLLGPTELQMNVNARVFYHAARYHLYGYRTYQVGDHLAELLRHTELAGLTGSDLHLPYPSIYLQTPLDTGLRVWNPQTQWHRLAGVYMSIEDGIDTPGCGDSVGRTLRALLVGEWEMKELPNGVMMPDDALLYWSIPLVDDWPIDRCVSHHKDHARDYSGHLPNAYRHMADEWDNIFTWLVNVVMYATSWQHRSAVRYFDRRTEQLRNRMAKSKNPRRRKSHAGELNKLDQRRYTELGHGVPSLSAGKGTGTALQKRTLVSGHWRNQAVGARWLERRRILIEPFWRGPEDDDESAVTHRLV